MHPKTIFSKTPKGVLEVKNKTAKLDRAHGQIFIAVDGKSTVSDLVKKADMSPFATWLTSWPSTASASSCVMRCWCWCL